MGSTTDRTEIEALFQRLARAHVDHDADAIVECYAPDAVIFDLAPPLGRRGMTREAVATWLSGWDGPILIDAFDVNLTVDRELAFSSSLTRMRGRINGEDRICGPVRRCVFGKSRADGELSTITRPCPSTWMGAIALRLI